MKSEKEKTKEQETETEPVQPRASGEEADSQTAVTAATITVSGEQDARFKEEDKEKQAAESATIVRYQSEEKEQENREQSKQIVLKKEEQENLRVQNDDEKEAHQQKALDIAYRIEQGQQAERSLFLDRLTKAHENRIKGINLEWQRAVDDKRQSEANDMARKQITWERLGSRDEDRDFF